MIYVFGPTLQGFFRFSLAGDAGFLVVNTTTDRRRHPQPRRLGGHERGAVRRVRARGARRAGPCDRDRERAAVERVRRVGRAVPGGPDLPRRGRGPQHAARPAGFGGNTGVADAHNLAWKLALVLDGSAGSATAGDVRRRAAAGRPSSPSSRRTPATSSGSIPSSARTTSSPSSRTLRSSSATGIDSSAVIAESDDDGSLHENPHEPSGRPGTRAPHVALDGGSTLDLFGRGFVVLSPSDAWCRAAEAASLDAQRIEAPGVRGGLRHRDRGRRARPS